MLALRELELPPPEHGVSQLDLDPGARLIRCYVVQDRRALFTKEPPAPRMMIALTTPEHPTGKPERRYFVIAAAGQGLPDGALFRAAVSMGPLTLYLFEVPADTVGELRRWVKDHAAREASEANHADRD